MKKGHENSRLETLLILEALKLIHVKVGGGKEYFVKIKKTLIRGERFSRPSHLRAYFWTISKTIKPIRKSFYVACLQADGP